MVDTVRTFLPGWKTYGQVIDTTARIALSSGQKEGAAAPTSSMGAPIPGSVTHMTAVMMEMGQRNELKEKLKLIYEQLGRNPDPPELKAANVQKLQMELQKVQQELEQKLKYDVRNVPSNRPDR